MFDRAELGRLRRDWRRRMCKYGARPRIWKLWFYWFDQVQYRPLVFYRLWKACRVPLLKGFLGWQYRRESLRCGLEIVGSSVVEGGVILAHYGSIKINAERVGRDLYVFHHVTIGSVLGKGRPVLGDNVMIGAGAQVLGKIRVGNNVVIGAGAVVLSDVPDGSVVVGNPGRVCKAIPPGHIAELIGYSLEDVPR
jgi:serine O-acetyltransferase